VAVKFVYLVQGAAERLKKLPLPAGAVVYALVYDQDVTFDFAKRTIFDPKCSFAAGRNQLGELALAAEPDADYFIFCDDDIEFNAGSFVEFERLVERSRPKMATPLSQKTRGYGAVDYEVEIQTAIVVDEQLVAIHRSAAATEGVWPLTTEFDDVSWWLPCQIFEYLALRTFGRHFHQYNKIIVENDVHTWQTGSTNYTLAPNQKRVPLLTEPLLKQYLHRRNIDYDPTVLRPWPLRHWRWRWLGRTRQHRKKLALSRTYESIPDPADRRHDRRGSGEQAAGPKI
jgi:hypothetical protein